MCKIQALKDLLCSTQRKGRVRAKIMQGKFVRDPIQGTISCSSKEISLNKICSLRVFHSSKSMCCLLSIKSDLREPNPSSVLLCPTPSYLPQPSGIIIIAIDQMATNTRLGELALCQSQLEKPISTRNSEPLCGKLLGMRLVAYQVPHARNPCT